MSLLRGRFVRVPPSEQQGTPAEVRWRLLARTVALRGLEPAKHYTDAEREALVSQFVASVEGLGFTGPAAADFLAGVHTTVDAAQAATVMRLWEIFVAGAKAMAAVGLARSPAPPGVH